MVFDVDRPGGAIAWEDALLPSPAWAAANPVNTHAHIAWGLSAPVLTCDAARLRPLNYLAALESAFSAKLEADPGYSGLVTKNPAHTRWRVLAGQQKLWSLEELAEYVDLSKHLPRGQPEEIGLGRNCILFHRIRVWAYVAVRQHRGLRNYIHWQTEVLDKALTLNGDFRNPLMNQEVGHIAKSVAKWVWKRDPEAKAAFIARQAVKGAMGGKRSAESRRAASENKRSSARLMRAKGMTQVEVAKHLGVSERTVRQWEAEDRQ